MVSMALDSFIFDSVRVKFFSQLDKFIHGFLDGGDKIEVCFGRFVHDFLKH